MPTLLSMFERSVTGLDIGTWSAKVVELKVQLREVEVVRCGELQFDRNATPEEKDAALRLYLTREEYALESVISALPGYRLTQRHLHFPFVGKQVAAAVPLALEEELPVPLDGMVLTQESLSQRKPTDRTDVLAVLAPTRQVGEHLEHMQSVGCDPSVVEVEGAVLANALAFLGWTQSPKLVLDIGHHHTSVVLVSGGKPLLIRSIGVAGKHFTEAIGAELGLEPEAAEKHKLENGLFRAGTTEPSLPRLGALLDQLTREALRSVQAMINDPSESVAPSEILLCGGSAALADLPAYLTERTRIPCRPVRMPERPGLGPLATDPHPERYLQALALALRGTQRAATQSDFRQNAFRYTADFSSLRRDLQWTTLLFGLVLLLWPLANAAELLSANLVVGRLEDRIAEAYAAAVPEAPSPRDPMSALRDTMNETEELANHLGVTGAGASPLDLLKEIHQRIPPDLEISLEELRIERYSVRARGIAPDITSVERMRQELGKFELFRDVDVSNVGSIRGQAGRRFELTIELERQL